MITLPKSLGTLFGNRRVSQSGILYAGMMSNILLGAGVAVVNTRLLGKELYGDYQFLVQLFILISTVVTPGFLVTGSRLLALEESVQRRRSLAGALLVVTAAVSLFMTLVLFAFSFFHDQWFQRELGLTIRIVCPLVFAFPLRVCVDWLLQGENRIGTLTLMRTIPQLLYLVVALGIGLSFGLSVTSAVLAQLGTLSLVLVGLMAMSRPNLRRLRTNLRALWVANKDHGFQVYIGTLAGVATGHLAAIFIGLFGDSNVDVGYFSLAVRLAMPLTLIPATVATTFFREFAHRESIPRSATMATLVASGLSLGAFLLLAGPVVRLLYSVEFAGVVPLLQVCAVAAVCHGFGDYYNRFLGAKGKGRDVRNGAILTGICNLVGFTFLVAEFGAMGAAGTKVIASVVYCAAMYLAYRKVTRRSAQEGAL